MRGTAERCRDSSKGRRFFGLDNGVHYILKEFAVRCMDAGVISQLLENEGAPAEQIILEAQRFDLILLGQHANFHFATQGTPNDTISKVLQQAPRPVVTVPDELPEGNAIVVAYDGSLQAVRTLGAFEATGLGLGIPVHVITVASRAEAASRSLSLADEYLRHHEIETVLHSIASSADPAEVLLDHAEAFDAQLVVMGCFGQSAWREFFLGSVTRAMLRDAQVPLFLYH